METTTTRPTMSRSGDAGRRPSPNLPSPSASYQRSSLPSRSERVSADLRRTISQRSATVGLTVAEADRRLRKYGPNALSENCKPRWRLFLEQFTGPLPIGIWIAIIIEAALHNAVDVCVLLSLQLINGVVGFYENNKSDNAIKALKANLTAMAQVCRDGTWSKIDATLIVPGDLISLGAGSAVPADCRVIDGTVHIDQSSLTGESLPVRMSDGDEAKMGSTATRGEANAIVTATGMDTSYGNTASMVNVSNGNSSDALAALLLRIVTILLVLSVTLCTITFAYMLMKKVPFKSALSFNVVILVSSIPIAIEVVVTATLALGSRELSSHSAIVTNLAAIERLAGMSILCSDKTGTLTLNQMMIQDQCLTFPHGSVPRQTLLLYSALATRWREPAKDAIDTMILAAADLDECDTYEQNVFTPFDSEIKRTEAICTSKDGVRIRIVKGAPDAVIEMCVNKEEIRDEFVTAVDDYARRGIRSLAIACSQGGDDENLFMVGIVTFLDPPRKDAKKTIALASSYGVAIKMITGDHQNVAQNTAHELQLGVADIVPCGLPELDLSEDIPDDLGYRFGDMIESCDGMSGALPGQKFVMVEALKQNQHIVGMTGDGVNDAPALKHAHCGIAVVGATDAARASADIVLTTPGLSAIVEAILIARRIHAKMGSFLVYRIAATLQLLFFFFISILLIHPKTFNKSFPEFWSMPIIGLICITVLNDGTIISVAYDSVKTARTPKEWDMKELWIMSSVLGAVACSSSLLILCLALASENIPALEAIGFKSLTFPQIVTIMFLKVAISDFMTVFSARTGVKPFYSFRPSWHVLVASVIALSCSTIVALTWPFPSEADEVIGQPISFYLCFIIWMYCVLVFIAQDVAKVTLFKVLYKFGILHSQAPNNLSLTSIAYHFDEDDDSLRGL